MIKKIAKPKIIDKTYNVKKGRDGKYRVGRKVVVKNGFGYWMYKTTGIAFVKVDLSYLNK